MCIPISIHLPNGSCSVGGRASWPLCVFVCSPTNAFRDACFLLVDTVTCEARGMLDVSSPIMAYSRVYRRVQEGLLSGFLRFAWSS